MNRRDPALPSPALFGEVIGQATAVQALIAAARRPVHAYFLLGPSGSGMPAAARAFAAALLCRQGGCGTCRDCRLCLAGHHPDLVMVARAGASLSVEEARRLVTLSQRRPFEAERQVIVLPDVHLAVRAAPALLKTIEEPPGPTVFVVMGDDVPPELETVASRCVTVRFSPVPQDALAESLRARGVAPEIALQAAESSGGDLDRATVLAEDPSVVCRAALWRSVPARLDGTGAAVGALVSEILDANEAALEPLRARQRTELEVQAEEAAAFGERGAPPGRREVMERHRREERRWRTDELRAGLGVLARAYRDRLVEGVRPGGHDAGGPGPGGQGAGGPGPGGRGDHIPVKGAMAECNAIDRITEVAGSLEHNPNQRLTLEALFLRISRL